MDGLSRRLDVPFCPEYELFYFSAANFSPLREAVQAAAGARKSRDIARRGRLRRLLGDVAGARADLESAAKTGSGEALLWLGELELERPRAEDLLQEAAERLPNDPTPWLYLGASRLVRRRARAADALERFVLRRPNSTLGHILCGLARQREGRVVQALQSYARAAQIDPSCSAACLLSARALGDGDAAVKACEAAFDADPEYAHLAMCFHSESRGWAESLRRIVRFAFGPRRFLPVSARFLELDRRILPGHFEGAQMAEDFLRLHPDRSWSLGLLGRAYARMPPSKVYKSRALKAFDRAVALSPKQGWPRGWRGVARIGSGLQAQALVDMNKCLKLRPYYFWAYEWRGGLLLSQGRLREAETDLDRAVAMNPGYPFALNRRSLVRRRLGDYTGAVSDLDEAFRLDPRYCWVFSTGRAPGAAECDRGIAELTVALRRCGSVASLWVWRGQARLMIRDMAAALRDFERAVSLDPGHALSRAWYGKALSEIGRHAEARLQLSRAVELSGAHWVYRLWLASALRSSADAPGARRQLRELLRVRPRCSPAWLELSRCEFESGRARKALGFARKAAALDGRNADNRLLVAQALLALGRARAAQREADVVLAISPHQGRAWLTRAQARAILGQSDAARADYRHALAAFPFLFNDDQRRQVTALVGSA